MGGYDETPEMFAAAIQDFANDGIVNMVGGCCGTNPEYIRQVRKSVEGMQPRVVPITTHLTMFSGLTEFIFRSNITFVNVGERCNISGSLIFKKMIVKGDYEAALQVAKEQV